jgi:hypothetical protein
MHGTLTRTLWLLLALNLVVVGDCPLAPVALLSPVRKGQCQHEPVPARGPHSCCVSVHHLPALVQPMLENSCALPAPAFALKPLLLTAQLFTIGRTALTPSPPLLSSVLRI